MFAARGYRHHWLKLALLCAAGVQPVRVAAVQPAAPAVAPPVETRPLESLPNLTVTYYDVSGTSIRSINDSILMQQGAEVSTSAATWDMSVSVGKRQVGEKCEITSANVKFSASVKLPRLANEQQVPGKVRKAWHAYLDKLKARQAADLWFVYDRLPWVEEAARKSSCDQVSANASAAIERIKAAEAELIQKRAASQAVAE